MKQSLFTSETCSYLKRSLDQLLIIGVLFVVVTRRSFIKSFKDFILVSCVIEIAIVGSLHARE